MHASSGSRSGNHSSSSSTASGPVTNSTRSNGKALDTLKKGERPKTEDFLTFLCLRGTYSFGYYLARIILNNTEFAKSQNTYFYSF